MIFIIRREESRKFACPANAKKLSPYQSSLKLKPHLAAFVVNVIIFWTEVCMKTDEGKDAMRDVASSNLLPL